MDVPRADAAPGSGRIEEVYGEADRGAGRRPAVAGELGDRQAALFGQTCFGAGEGKSTYGTGGFLLLNTGPTAVPSTGGLMTTLAYRLGSTPPVYALEGSIAVAGALVRWVRDNLGLIASAGEIEALARTACPTMAASISFLPFRACSPRIGDRRRAA